MNINLLSFILSIFCIPLFLAATTSANFKSTFTSFLGIHPLHILLGITLITFFLGMIGLKEVRDWKAMARSISTLILTLGLSGVSIFIIVIGRMLS